MDAIIQAVHDLVFDYTVRTVALGAATLGITAGVLGTFASLRRQSLAGDAVSHAALPGIAIVFLLTDSKTPIALLIGATLAGWLAMLFVSAIVRGSRIRLDAALALNLSVFFGVGMVLLTLIQRRPDGSQAGLDRFLFGQAATLVTSEVRTMAIVGTITVAAIALGWKEFKLLAFDPEFAVSIGWPIRLLDIILTTLLVISIALGLQAVGVVLMSAMVVAPAAAARQWSDRLGIVVILSAIFGAVAGVTGATVSGEVKHLPTGPAIVVIASLLVIISLLFAPKRGLISGRIRRQPEAAA